MSNDSSTDSDFPQYWDFEADGDITRGKAVRMTKGATKLYGSKPIAVLEVDGEERSVWLSRFVLREAFKEEFEARGKVELVPGEEISIKWLGKKQPKGGGPAYHNFEVLFHQGAGENLEGLFGLGESTERMGESDTGEPVSTSSVSDGDDKIPF